MSSKQNKSRRKTGRMERKSTPKSSAPAQTTSYMSRTGGQMAPVRMSTTSSLPPIGIGSQRTISTPHGPGVRVGGCASAAVIQKLIILGTMDWGALKSVVNGLSTSFIALHPFYINTEQGLPSRLQTMALNWTRFRFTKIKVHYTPTVGSGSNGQFALTYLEDPVASLSPGSSTFSSYCDSDGRVMVNNTWCGASIDLTPKLQKDYWFWIDINLDTDEGRRMAYQGIIGAAWSSLETTGTTIVTGTVWLEYEIDFAQPYIYSNNTLSSSSSESKSTSPSPRRAILHRLLSAPSASAADDSRGDADKSKSSDSACKHCPK